MKTKLLKKLRKKAKKVYKIVLADDPYFGEYKIVKNAFCDYVHGDSDFRTLEGAQARLKELEEYAFYELCMEVTRRRRERRLRKKLRNA